MQVRGVHGMEAMGMDHRRKNKKALRGGSRRSSLNQISRFDSVDSIALHKEVHRSRIWLKIWLAYNKLNIRINIRFY